MAMMLGWGRGGALLGLLLACEGVEPPAPVDREGSAGLSGAYLHGGSSGCGGLAVGGAGVAGGGSALPGDFATDPAGAGGAAGGQASSAGGAHGGTGADSPAALARAFVFTEYVEGSSTYKALEITALEDSSLDGCRVALYFNGGTTASGSALEGTLVEGQSYVVCSSALAEIVGCDSSAGLTFNGDDAIALECEGAIVDAIGQIGFDPGTTWGEGDLSLVDHTLRRSCDVGAGDDDASDAFDPSGEWLGQPKDSFEDLGTWSCESPSTGGGEGGGHGGGATEAPAGAHELVFTEYVEGSSTYKALEITALEDSSLDGCRVALYFNGGTTATGSELQGVLDAGKSYVVCSTALAEITGSCDQSAGLNFNGDDAITLECDGLVVDTIGQVGFDPGTAWGSGDLALIDHTLRRSCDVTSGDADTSDAFDPSGEWAGFALDSFEDLGARTCE